MNHNEWFRQIHPLLAGGGQTPPDVVPRLRRLAAITRRELKTGIAPWHEEQALALAAIHLSETGQHANAGRQYEALLRILRSSLLYYLRSSIDNLEAAQRAYTAAGNPTKATRLQTQQAVLSRVLVEVLGARHSRKPRRPKPAV